MSTKKNELAKAEPQLPAVVIDYGVDAGSGTDDIGRDEAGIPFLKILQAQSPEVIGPDGIMEGARAGSLLNTGTEQLNDEITLVPAFRQHVFVEWKPRDAGGGIVAVHQKDSDVVQASIAASDTFGKYTTEGGNDLVETFYVFAVVMEDDSPAGFVVVPFSSMQIKKYKKGFINRLAYCLVDNGQGGKVKPPMFAHRITLGTEVEKNDKGVWSNYVVKFAVDNNVQQSLMAPDHPGFAAAKELRAMVASGEAVADTSKASGAEGGADDTDDSAF